MNKTAVVLIIGAIILLIGFIYLKSQPAPAPSISTQQTIVLSPSPSMKPSKQYSQPPEMQIDVKKTYTANIKTSKGNLKINLHTNKTPVTVNNFIFLAREGFYDQTSFHRIISGFMIQGGDPQGDGTGGPGYSFNDEPITQNYARGILAMANSGPNTNGSQFFIVHQNTDLPKNYVIFGELADDASLQTLDAITATPVTDNPITGEPNSFPAEQVIVETVTIEES